MRASIEVADIFRAAACLPGSSFGQHRARRELLNVAAPPDRGDSDEPDDFRPACPCCGGRMIVIETFECWRQPRGPPEAGNEPGERPMTGHGVIQLQALGITDPGVAMALADANSSGPTPGRPHRAEAQQSGPLAPSPAIPSGGRAIADISRNPKSP